MKNKYVKAYEYMNTVKNGSYPSYNTLTNNINRLNYKTKASFETAILRAKAYKYSIMRGTEGYEFNENWCVENVLALRVGYLESQDHTRHGIAEFEKKIWLFQEIIARENMEFFNVVYNDYIKKFKISVLKDLGT